MRVRRALCFMRSHCLSITGAGALAGAGASAGAGGTCTPNDIRSLISWQQQERLRLSNALGACEARLARVEAAALDAQSKSGVATTDAATVAAEALSLKTKVSQPYNFSSVQTYYLLRSFGTVNAV